MVESEGHLMGRSKRHVSAQVAISTMHPGAHSALRERHTHPVQRKTQFLVSLDWELDATTTGSPGLICNSMLLSCQIRELWMGYRYHCAPALHTFNFSISAMLSAANAEPSKREGTHEVLLTLNQLLMAF